MQTLLLWLQHPVNSGQCLQRSKYFCFRQNDAEPVWCWHQGLCRGELVVAIVADRQLTGFSPSSFRQQMDPVQKAVINHTFGVPLIKTKRPVISCNVCQIRFNSEVREPRGLTWEKNALGQAGVRGLLANSADTGLKFIAPLGKRVLPNQKEKKKICRSAM